MVDNSPDIGVPIMRTPAHFRHALAMYLVCSPFAFRCHPIAASFYLSLTTNSPPNKSMTVGHNVVADRQNGYICIYIYICICILFCVHFSLLNLLREWLTTHCWPVVLFNCYWHTKRNESVTCSLKFGGSSRNDGQLLSQRVLYFIFLLLRKYRYCLVFM